jgi:hypothetical protein
MIQECDRRLPWHAHPSHQHLGARSGTGWSVATPGTGSGCDRASPHTTDS